MKKLIEFMLNYHIMTHPGLILVTEDMLFLLCHYHVPDLEVSHIDLVLNYPTLQMKKLRYIKEYDMEVYEVFLQSFGQKVCSCSLL